MALSKLQEARDTVNRINNEVVDGLDLANNKDPMTLYNAFGEAWGLDPEGLRQEVETAVFEIGPIAKFTTLEKGVALAFISGLCQGIVLSGGVDTEEEAA